MSDINLNETAKMIRETLKVAFPKTKFSVRSKSYSGGCSIHAGWTDGPTEDQVSTILNRFEGRGFDGMTDSSFYCGERTYKGKNVEFCGAYINGGRDISVAVVKAVADRVAYDCGVSTPEINERGGINSKFMIVPFNWHRPANDAEYITMDAITSADHLLWNDRYQGEPISTLIHRVLHFLSFEEQQPVELPEYINSATEAAAVVAAKELSFPALINERVN